MTYTEAISTESTKGHGFSKGNGRSEKRSDQHKTDVLQMLNKQASISSHHMNNPQITKGKECKKADLKVPFCQEKEHTTIFIY